MTETFKYILPPSERMDLNKLKEIGFSDGEIKVYSALIKLKKSTISKIIEYSNVSSSKVYIILDKLIHKGLINYIMKKNIKEFHLSNPNNLHDFIINKKKSLIDVENNVIDIIKEINQVMGKMVQESAHVYKGLAGLKAAHLRLTNELNKGEEYVFFSVEKSALKQDAVRNMFKKIHVRRDERGVTARGIALPSLRKTFEKHLPSTKKCQIRYHNLTLNQGITIGKNRIIIETAHPDAFAVEIISSKTAESYREFFNKLWKTAKE